MTTQDFKKKHDAVLNYIRLKSIAQQWINNTYSSIANSNIPQDSRTPQCLSEGVGPDDEWTPTEKAGDPVEGLNHHLCQWQIDRTLIPHRLASEVTPHPDEELWAVPSRKKKKNKASAAAKALQHKRDPDEEAVATPQESSRWTQDRRSRAWLKHASLKHGQSS